MRENWSPESEQLLRDLYPDTQTKDLVKVFNRPIEKIHSKASRMKIRKSEAFLKSELSGRLSGQRGVLNRFQKGMPGWNKGLKQKDYMSAESIANCSRTRFKPGHDPHNTVDIGHVRMTKDGYLEMKIRHDKSGKNKNFVLLQRLIWECEYGKIPKGFIVEFVDGNSLNLDLSNLRLTSRVENCLRNVTSDRSIVKRFFGCKDEDDIAKVIEDIPQLIELKRTILLLQYKLNKKNGKESATV